MTTGHEGAPGSAERGRASGHARRPPRGPRHARRPQDRPAPEGPPPPQRTLDVATTIAYNCQQRRRTQAARPPCPVRAVNLTAAPGQPHPGTLLGATSASRQRRALTTGAQTHPAGHRERRGGVLGQRTPRAASRWLLGGGGKDTGSGPRSAGSPLSPGSLGKMGGIEGVLAHSQRAVRGCGVERTPRAQGARCGPGCDRRRGVKSPHDKWWRGWARIEARGRSCRDASTRVTADAGRASDAGIARASRGRCDADRAGAGAEGGGGGEGGAARACAAAARSDEAAEGRADQADHDRRKAVSACARGSGAWAVWWGCWWWWVRRTPSSW